MYYLYTNLPRCKIWEFCNLVQNFLLSPFEVDSTPFLIYNNIFSSFNTQTIYFNPKITLYKNYIFPPTFYKITIFPQGSEI